jgi:hypothetical protein
LLSIFILSNYKKGLMICNLLKYRPSVWFCCGSGELINRYQSANETFWRADFSNAKQNILWNLCHILSIFKPLSKSILIFMIIYWFFTHRTRHLNQTLVEWSLDGRIPKLCPVIPTSNQDGRQAKNRKKGGWNFNCPLNFYF